MARVFISYASEDRAEVARLHHWLTTARHEVFLAADLRDGIAGGEHWRLSLHERLRWADAVVCLLTVNYLASTWCAAEVAIAQSRGSRLIPVVAESEIAHPLLSDDIQRIDLIRDPAGAPAALEEALRRVDAAGGLGWLDDQSPFPGLRPFELTQHQVFFGRRDETEELAELLRSTAEQARAAMLLVVGPSGCGKSSLVRAGLGHAMAQEPGWRTLPPILPGTDPVAALGRELAAAARHSGLDWTVGHVHHQLAEHGLARVVDELLVAIPGGSRRHLLIVVDQFEELLTQTGSGARARFAALLRPALSGPVRVVATLRPEFVQPLLLDADLAGLPTHTYLLRPLRRAALPAVIQGPARLAGIGVDDDLVARLVADTDSGEALPLLAFTLARLAEQVRRGGRLSLARYAELGGVRGALVRQADAALADAMASTGRCREEVIAGLLRLVTVDEKGRPTRWRVHRDELPDPVTRELDVFVERRLVTTDSDNGSAVVGVAHEAFLSAWPPLAQAIEENASALRAARVVEQAAAEWHKEHRSAARLWERGQLAAALADTGAHLHAHELVTDHVDLSPRAQDFLRVSIRRDRLRRGRALSVLSVLLVVALVAAGVAFVQRRGAVDQRNIAVSRQVAGQALELSTTNPALAAQLALAAYRLSHTPEARGSLLSTVASPYSTRVTGHTSTVRSVGFSPDGRTLATASDDHTTRLWDVHDPHHLSPLSTLTGHTNNVESVVFSPDGRTLATASADHTTRLWDVSAPQYPHPLSTLTGHTSDVESVAFSPDGRTLATASDDHTTRLWRVNDPHYPNLLSILTGHTNNIWSVAFSPDGHTLASGSRDGTARLWDLPGSILAGHISWISSVAFSSDGRTLATGSGDRTVRLWDVNDTRQPRLLATLTGHTDTVWTLAFSPDGRTLATGSFDRTVRLWDVRDPRYPHPLSILTGHTNSVDSVAFNPHGNTLATTGDDTTVRLWEISDLRHPYPLSTLTGHTNNVESVVFSPDGHTLATASADNTARLWEIDVHRVAARICRITPAITASEWHQYLPDLPYQPPCR